MKQRYITPQIKVIQLLTDDNIAQFVVSSHSVGENEGLAKPGIFDEDEEGGVGEQTMADYSPWEERKDYWNARTDQEDRERLFLVNIFINPLMAEKGAKTDGFPNRIDMRLQRGRCLLLLQMRCSPTLDGIYSYFRHDVVLLQTNRRLRVEFNRKHKTH